MPSSLPAFPNHALNKSKLASQLGFSLRRGRRSGISEGILVHIVAALKLIRKDGNNVGELDSEEFADSRTMERTSKNPDDKVDRNEDKTNDISQLIKAKAVSDGDKLGELEVEELVDSRDLENADKNLDGKADKKRRLSAVHRRGVYDGKIDQEEAKAVAVSGDKVGELEMEEFVDTRVGESADKNHDCKADQKKLFPVVHWRDYDDKIDQEENKTVAEIVEGGLAARPGPVANLVCVEELAHVETRLLKFETDLDALSIQFLNFEEGVKEKIRNFPKQVIPSVWLHLQILPRSQKGFSLSPFVSL